MRALSLLVAAACNTGTFEKDDNGGSGGSGDSGLGGGGCDVAADADGDGLDDCSEEEAGTDPTLADSDGDGFDDLSEISCLSDALDPGEFCYTCGWPHGDPGTLVSDGADEGNTVENIPLTDQCGEDVDLWDFAGSYHILFMTASW